ARSESRTTAGRSARGSLNVSLLATVEEEDAEDRASVEDVASPVGHVLGEQQAHERDERDRAGCGPEVVAAAAQDRDAADHHGGDRLEQVRLVHPERGLAA